MYMDAPDHRHPRHHAPIPNGGGAVRSTEETPPDPSSSCTMNNPDFPTTIAKRKNKKKKQTLVSDTESSASSNNCCCTASNSQKGIKIFRNPRRIRVGSVATTRKSVRPSEVDALGGSLGMSIAAVFAQVLERKNAAGDKMSLDYLSGICISVVRESLGIVFGDKFDNFMTNFEKSFQSTLITLRSISDAKQNVGEQLQRARTASNLSSLEKLDDSACPSGGINSIASLPHRNITEQHERGEKQDSFLDLASKLASPDRIRYYVCPLGGIDALESLPHRNSTEQQERAENQDRSFELARTLESLDRLEDSAGLSGDSTHRQSKIRVQKDENVNADLLNRQLVLHDKQVEQPLASTSLSNSTINQNSMISTMEQIRSKDLKTLEIGLNMKKLQLKERQLELNSEANRLEMWKLSMEFSKSSFKAEKFKTQLQDSRQVDLLKKCLDFLVAGLIIMLCSLAYGTYVYSHQRIIEATEACSPYSESKSWWMPKSVSTLNSGLQLLKCQIQVFSRMLFGVLMISAIVLLLIQRSATSHHTMPVTFILLLLGVACGYAGKFCIDTLGASGTHWLIYWETLCLLHFFANAFHSNLFFILNGPITVAERVEPSTAVPYWMRRSLFYGTLLFLPLLCGFTPFATPWEWFSHFSRQASDFVTYVDD